MLYRFVLLLVSLLPNLIVGAQTKIPTAELQEDFAVMRDKICKYNAGLYEFVEEAQLMNYWDSLAATITQPMTEREFSQVIVKALIPVKERHMSQGFSKKSEYTIKYTKNQRKVLPLYVYFMDNDDAYILRNASTDSTIQPGAKLLAINDKPIQHVQQQIFDHIIVDQGVTSWKYFETNAKFNALYYQFVDTVSTFNIQFVDTLGITKSAILEGVTRKVYLDSVNTQTKRIFDIDSTETIIRKPLSTEFYDSISVAKLKISTFNKEKLRKGKVQFKSAVNTFFDEVAEKNIAHVIIDVRGNTGGRIKYLAHVLSYIKKSEERPELLDRTYYRWLKPKETRSKEEKAPKQQKDYFDGEVYVLTDGGSYSAAVMMAVFARELADAKIVGQPTGGRYNGTTAGSFKEVKLKNSNLRVRVPLTLFSYFVEEQEEGGVQPDIEVSKKIENFFEKSDYQLETLLEHIEQNGASQ
ncbi:MAG: S41 family peptidase [Saprospiraceae bacterium]|nr:S41 family peptidase [Saprospiraceae bacterium]